MKKIFSFMLIAAGLLISGQVKAGSVKSLTELETAIATPNVTIDDVTAVIAINKNLDFNGATINIATKSMYLNASGKSGNYTWSNLTINQTNNANGAIYQMTYKTTLTLQNVQITNTKASSYAVYMNVADAVLNVKSTSSLSGKSGSVKLNANGTINNEGTLNGINVATGKVATINNAAGATLNLKTSSNGVINVANEGTCNVTAGTYAADLTFTGEGTVNITGGIFNGNVEGTGIEISGGKFTNKPDDSYLAAGLKFIFFEGYYQPVDVTTSYVAMNTTTNVKYYSLVDAFDNAEDNETIALLKDATLNSGSIVMYGKHAKGARNLTLDLAGCNISRSESIKPSYELSYAMFYLHEGSLNVTGKGTIQNSENAENYIFIVTGSNDPEAVEFSKLTIGAEVNLISSKGSAISIDGIQKDAAGTREKVFGYYTRESGNSSTPDHAYGVVLDVSGYVQAYKYAIKVNGLTTQLTGNIPYIHIQDGATLMAGEETKSVAIYSAGYANWEIDEAEISGNTGVYMKAGDLTIDGATIYSTGEYSAVVSQGSGVDAGGSAIVIESNPSYAGHQNIEIKGESTISGDGGYAIEEVASAAGSKCDNFIISGGTFNNGTKGCITTTGTVQNNVVLNGTITGGVFGSNISDYLNQVSGVITPVVEGSATVYVVGEKPAGTPDWSSDLKSATEDSYISLQSATATTVTLDKDVDCAYLTATGVDKIVVEAGHTLNVGQLVMSDDASIVVEPGAKVIVNGENGIVAFSEDNLVIQASSDGMGAFVLNPDVESNKTPYATVQYFAKNASAMDADVKNNKFDIFVSPFVKIDEMTNNLTLEMNQPAWGTTKGSWYQIWNGNKWTQLTPSEVVDQLEAFQAIAITNTSKYVKNNYDNQVTYTFKGQLQGNTSGDFNVGKGFIYLGNGFVAPMDATKILGQLNDAKIEHNIWVWKNNGFFPIQEDNLESEMPAMGPMGFFVIKTKQPVELNLDYETLIWDFNK